MSYKKDVNGKYSSKRLWGARLLKLGLLLAVFFVLMWAIGFLFDKPIIFPSFLRDIWLGIMGAGTSVIIGTVFERPKTQNNGSTS